MIQCAKCSMTFHEGRPKYAHGGTLAGCPQCGRKFKHGSRGTDKGHKTVVWVEAVQATMLNWPMRVETDHG